MSIKVNLPIYVTGMICALIATSAMYLGYLNDKEHWQGKKEYIVVKEICYDKNTREQVRLAPLDIQQINSRAGRNFDGMWKNLECRIDKK